MSAQRICKKNMKRMYQEKVGQSMPTRPRKAKSDRLEGFAAHGNQANQHKRRGLAVAQFYNRRTVFPSADLADVPLQACHTVGVTVDCPFCPSAITEPCKTHLEQPVSEPEIPPARESTPIKKPHGGKRPAAGRKPNLVKRMIAHEAHDGGRSPGER